MANGPRCARRAPGSVVEFVAARLDEASSTSAGAAIAQAGAASAVSRLRSPEARTAGLPRPRPARGSARFGRAPARALLLLSTCVGTMAWARAIGGADGLALLAAVKGALLRDAGDHSA